MTDTLTTHDLRCRSCSWMRLGVQGDEYARELWRNHEIRYDAHVVEVAE